MTSSIYGTSMQLISNSQQHASKVQLCAPQTSISSFILIISQWPMHHKQKQCSSFNTLPLSPITKEVIVKKTNFVMPAKYSITYISLQLSHTTSPHTQGLSWSHQASTQVQWPPTDHIHDRLHYHTLEQLTEHYGLNATKHIMCNTAGAQTPQSV